MGQSQGNTRNDGTQLLIKKGFAFQIIELKANSPFACAGVQAFLDFITDVQAPAQAPAKDFYQLVEQNEGQELQFTVYNIKRRQESKLQITPSKKWPNADSLLGAVLRYEQLENYLERTFRIVSVMPNSPAQHAGLQEQDDYILALVDQRYQDIDDLIKILVETEKKHATLKFAVYSAADASVRVATLCPDAKWGGQGIIGCEFGCGFLNQLPISKACSQIVEAPASSIQAANKIQDRTLPTIPPKQPQEVLTRTTWNKDSPPRMLFFSTDERAASNLLIEHKFQGILRYNQLKQ